MTEEQNKQTPVIELNGVTKEYCLKQTFFSKGDACVLATNNIDLTIQKGEIFGLVGQSGSGKTTIGRLLVKLEEPSKGIIKMNGKPIHDLHGNALKNYRSKVQMIFQDPYASLNPRMSVYDTLAEPLLLHNIENKKTMANRNKAGMFKLPVTAAQPTKGGIAPAPPPITIFCTVAFFKR